MDDANLALGEKLITSRRQFLKFGAAAALVGVSAPAFAHNAPVTEKVLSFSHLHTGEFLTSLFWADGRYVPEGIDEISHLLRDFRTDEVMPIDPGLLDLLYAVRAKLKSEGAFQVISGYRSPKTNKMLRKNGRGVAKRSYHLKGQAVDVGLPGRRLSHLRKAAIALKTGGVGYYPRSKFVHLDVGPVRYW